MPGDGDENLWSLENLPDNWDMFKAPEPDLPPTCFVITLDGSQAEIKMQAVTTIVMDMKTFELMELYRDLQKMVLGVLPSQSPFFLNSKGKELSRLQNYTGSLLAKFGMVIFVLFLVRFTTVCYCQTRKAVYHVWFVPRSMTNSTRSRK